MLAGKHSCSRMASGALTLVVASFALGPVQAHGSAAVTTTTLAITSGTTSVTSVSSETAVTLTATVKVGTAAVQAGQVKFCDAQAAHCTDIHILGMAQLTASGSASFRFLPGPGVHNYKAEFLGTTANGASSSVASALTVNGAPSLTAIAQSGAAGNYTLKATVTGTGSPIGPTGKISFLDTSTQNAVLGTAELGTANESFTWTTTESPATSAAPHSIAVADFNRDGIPI